MEGEEEEWVPYSRRSEWKDVEPIRQRDDDDVVRILYSEKFADIYDYFRAVYVSQEVSERALALTMDAAVANPANYTVWHHRRFLLKALNKDLASELDLCRDIMEENPKSYQIWEHRRRLVEWMEDPSRELRITEIILARDAKNYHAWQHRQWVISNFNLFEGELEFVDRLIQDDVRNNSAWNERFFVLKRTAPSKDGIIKGDALKNELNYAMKAIEKCFANESSWNYLTGLMNQCPDEEIEEVRKKISDFCYDLHDNKKVDNRYLLATIVDVHVKALDKCNKEKSAHSEKAIQTCRLLADKKDVVRAEYWRFLERNIHNKYPVA